VTRSASRYLFYAHDGMGLGHLRRNLAIATALVELDPGASILMTASPLDVSRICVPDHVDMLALPGLRKVSNGRYMGRRLRIPGDEVRAVRSALLTAAVESFKPTVLLADKHPLGVRGELRDGLEAQLARGGRAALGLRDVLDAPATVRAEWSRASLDAHVARCFDRVLVYGSRAVLDSVQEYGLSSRVADRTEFCGYVLNHPEGFCRAGDRAALPARRKRPVVLATVGGGEDGRPLLEAFIETAHDARWDGIVVAGPLAAAREARLLRRRADAAGVAFYGVVPGLTRWLDDVDALVCMGGYNTMAEAVSRGTPTVCVPRTRPRVEQLIRARAFARLGLSRVLEPSRLNAAALRREVETVLGSPRGERAARAASVLGFDGARRAAEQLVELAAAGRKVSAPDFGARPRWRAAPTWATR
jgi:predicted glycosyltransferase